MKVVESGAAGRPFCYHNKSACNACERICAFRNIFFGPDFSADFGNNFFCSSAFFLCNFAARFSRRRFRNAKVDNKFN
jgi:hypothetical protein